ncbi:MAG: hypothetical protein JWO81_3127 [Alphaproteobacteria bacterium]|nr:hypothetical protein [Alphaproteobacteria bacterium]
MTLIGNIDPSWKDMSTFVVHFAKPTSGKSAYDNAISILYERRIIAKNAFGAGRHLAPARKSVCFSEVPLHHLKRLADVRGQHGIGFQKEYVSNVAVVPSSTPTRTRCKRRRSTQWCMKR